ncbi:hypothetical protein SNEBB_010603 [Seison nebaliae]|nr:hypothetical protein SNEBB_010603 [Seison nebaliae]
MNSLSAKIELDNTSLTFYEGDVISGILSMNCTEKERRTIQSIFVYVEGYCYVCPSKRTINDNISDFLERYELIATNNKLEFGERHKFSANDGKKKHLIELPFNISLLSTNIDEPLLESYRGNCLDVIYKIRIEIKRGVFYSSIHLEQLIFVHTMSTKNVGENDDSISFTMMNTKKEDVETTEPKQYWIEGIVDHSTFPLDHMFSGTVKIKESSIPIKNIDLLLLRSETYKNKQGLKENKSTEIQSIQCADGNLSSDREVALYMMFPRDFTCRSSIRKHSAIEFSICINITFSNNVTISKEIPIKLKR